MTHVLWHEWTFGPHTQNHTSTLYDKSVTLLVLPLGKQTFLSSRLDSVLTLERHRVTDRKEFGTGTGKKLNPSEKTKRWVLEERYKDLGRDVSLCPVHGEARRLPKWKSGRSTRMKLQINQRTETPRRVGVTRIWNPVEPSTSVGSGIASHFILFLRFHSFPGFDSLFSTTKELLLLPL